MIFAKSKNQTSKSTFIYLQIKSSNAMIYILKVDCLMLLILEEMTPTKTQNMSSIKLLSIWC